MRKVFALFVGLAASAAAAAQDEAGQSDNDSPIIVEGQRPDALRTLRQVRALSQDTDGNLARFETAVCPGVAGLPTQFAAAIVKRLRQDVGDLGVELAPEGCDPNLTVIVTDDGAALVDGLSRKGPTMFGFMTSSEITRLRRSPGPAWVWQATSPKRADGGPVARIDSVSLGSGPPQHVPKGAFAVPGASQSRLSSPVRQDTGLAFVVLSRAAIEGKSVTQIADYAALRGLAGTRSDAGDRLGPQSIGSLFASDHEAPEALTDFDRAYLTSLYSGSNGKTYDQKTREIALDVAKILDR